MFKAKQIRIAVLATGISLLMAGAAYAQYIGPGNEKMPVSVSAIMKKPIDGQHVLLEGYIIKMIGKDMYLFSDGTAKINVDIDDKFFLNGKISDTTKVELYGEVEKELLRDPVIEVKRLTILAP